MAYVRQSEAGAKAVMGSKMVLVDTCSEVEGSKRMTSPFPFPCDSSACILVGREDEVLLTKRYIAITHPGSYS
jgi:hypothetical protein